jgi:hypothetical protein
MGVSQDMKTPDFNPTDAQVTLCPFHGTLSGGHCVCLSTGDFLVLSFLLQRLTHTLQFPSPPSHRFCPSGYSIVFAAGPLPVESRSSCTVCLQTRPCLWKDKMFHHTWLLSTAHTWNSPIVHGALAASHGTVSESAELWALPLRSLPFGLSHGHKLPNSTSCIHLAVYMCSSCSTDSTDRA